MKIEQLKKELHKLQHSILNEVQNDNLQYYDVERLLGGIKTIQHTIDFFNELDEMLFESEVEDE